MKDVSIIYLLIIFTILGKPASAEEDSKEYGVTAGAKKTSCPCGHLNKNQGRIVDGEEAELNEFPFMAGIRTKDVPFVFCGGAIISHFFVLTAAHCTDPRYYESLAVIVGDHNVYDHNDTIYAEVYSVKKVIQHELYDKKGEEEFDIALLLTEKIFFNQFVEPICFPSVKTDLVGQRVKIMGWGRSSLNGPYLEILHKATVEIVSLNICDDYFNAINVENPSQLCTYSPDTDTCHGDSGGPLAWRDPDTNRYTLVGLVSFGDLCGKKQTPAVNTDVFYHKDWIIKHMAETRPKAKTCIKV